MSRQSPRTDSSVEPPSRPDPAAPATGLADRVSGLLSSLLSGPATRRPGNSPGRARLLAIPALALALAACGGGHDDYYDGYYNDPSCNPALYPAVAVRFVDPVTSQPVLIGANGSIHDGRRTEEMSSPEPGYAVDGRATVLEGAFGRPGVYDVSVVTRAGERYDWTAIRVGGDYCEIYTVELQAPVHFPDP